MSPNREYWTQGHWKTGTPGNRDTRTPGHWDIGAPGHRDIGTLGHRGTMYIKVATKVVTLGNLTKIPPFIHLDLP